MVFGKVLKLMTESECVPEPLCSISLKRDHAWTVSSQSLENQLPITIIIVILKYTHPPKNGQRSGGVCV